MNNPIIQLVASLKPGEEVDISQCELDALFQIYKHNGAYIYPEDQVLENIVGSAYEFYYVVNFFSRSVTFGRLAKPLKEPTSYKSPDRR